MADTMADGFDHIVVGAGSAGCVLAHRLSADPARRVLLLEAGGRSDGLLFRMPIGFTRLWFDPRHTWGLTTEPEEGLGGRRLPLPRGRVLGGSSAINGMVYNHGQPHDFERWQAAGLPDWGHADLLPYLKRVQHHWRGEDGHHGGAGPVAVNPHPWPMQRAAQAALDAARGMGWPVTDDWMGPRPEGVTVPDFNIAQGRRVSSHDAYVAPVRDRRNLTVRTGCQVLKVLVEGGRAVGVRYRESNEVRESRAAGVVLCGGAFHSPHLLMLSGIGPADALRAHGIAVVHDAAAVGAGLVDQPATGIEVVCREPVAFDDALRLDRVAASAVRWQLRGTGPLTAPPVVVAGAVRSSPDEPSPDLRLMIGAVGIDSRIWWRRGQRKGHVLIANMGLAYPQSRGSVTLRNADPLAPPVIRYGLLTAPEDVVKLRRAYQLLRDWFRQPALQALYGQVARPAKDPADDHELDAMLRQGVAHTQHPLGTCRMGSDAGSVVDPRLRVRGIAGLRVVDASVLPGQICGNPNSIVMAVAERAAEFILSEPAP